MLSSWRPGLRPLPGWALGVGLSSSSSGVGWGLLSAHCRKRQKRAGELRCRLNARLGSGRWLKAPARVPVRSLASAVRVVHQNEKTPPKRGQVRVTSATRGTHGADPSVAQCTANKKPREGAGPVGDCSHRYVGI
jgi:hypothetical protein